MTFGVVLCHSEVMDLYRVTEGVYDLRGVNGFANIARLRSHLDWLHTYYLSQGWPVGRIRQDVLDLAQREDRLDASYADQVFDLTYRFARMHEDAHVFTFIANDSKMRFGGASKWRDQKLEGDAVAAYRLPKLTWCPFKPISRARVLSIEELIPLLSKVPR